MIMEFQYNKTFFLLKKDAEEFARQVYGDLYSKDTEEYQHEINTMDSYAKELCKELPYVVVYGEYSEV